MSLNSLAADIHKKMKDLGWWDALQTRLLSDVVPEKLLMAHTELSEATEGFRKGLMDDKLPHRMMAEVELADTIIRVLDLAAACDFDLDGAVKEKMAFNLKRADHKRENRAKEGGKKF